MSLYHVKSNTVADMTGTITGYNSAGSTTTLAATNLVRPSDWNSVHNVIQNLSGNTLGTSQVSGTDIVWAGGNGITLSASGSTISIHGDTAADRLFILGNTAGAQSSTSGDSIYLSGGDNITLSNSAGTINIAGAAAVTGSQYILGNTAGAQSSTTGNALYLSGGGNITLSNNAGTINIGGPALVTNSLNSFGFLGASSTLSQGQSSLYMQFFPVGGPYLSICRIDQIASLAIAATTSFTTSCATNVSSISTAAANTWSLGRTLGLYTLASGASSTGLSLLASTTVSLGGTKGYSYSFSISSNSVTHGATNGFSLGAVKNVGSNGALTYTTIGYSNTASNTASSAATISTTTGTTSIANVSTSLHTGMRALPHGWGTNLPSEGYWLGMLHASSSTSTGTNSTVMSISLLGMTTGTWTAFGHLTNTGNSSNRQLFPGQGVYSAQTGALPNSIALTQINNVSNIQWPGVAMNVSL